MNNFEIEAFKDFVYTNRIRRMVTLTLSRLKYFNTIKITHYNCGIIWPSEQWGAWMGIEVY